MWLGIAFILGVSAVRLIQGYRVGKAEIESKDRLIKELRQTINNMKAAHHHKPIKKDVLEHLS